MGAAKWIGGIIGFMAGGPLGALAGYALGSLFEGSSEYGNDSQSSQRRAYGDPWEPRDNGRSGYYGTGSQSYDAGQRNSFLFSLLVMASYIIKADGRVMHSEMEYVRRFLRQNFGAQAVTEGEQILLRLFEQRKQMETRNPGAFQQTIYDCGRQIAANLSYEERLQLLRFLAEIAKADGNVCSDEIEALRQVAAHMGLTPNEVDSMLNMGGNTLEAAYKVLEITPDATDAEVRAAYRKMALKHHPDRVATLGEDVKHAAEEKFKEINEAKEKIWKARGMK